MTDAPLPPRILRGVATDTGGASAPAASELGEAAQRAAERLGLAKIGVAPVEPPLRFDLYRRWLADGRHGEMTYLAAPEHLAARADLTTLLKSARTVLVAALAYDRGETGGIARYARGDDYHMVLRDKLRALADELASASGRAIAFRTCVDSAPVLERELAEKAGLGFVGKHTLVILPGVGSYVVLGELLLDLELTLPGQSAPQPTRCGTCRACLDACPTGALDAEFSIDARRCISYLTIESERPVPEELRPKLGGWFFGCDACQEACPYNQAPARAPVGLPARPAPDLLALAKATSNQLKKLVRRSALRRIDRARLLSNVCIALGNVGDARALPALEARTQDASPLVRDAATWALAELRRRG